MPTSDIVPYSIGVKMTPTFHIVQLDPQCLKLVLNEDPTPTAYKLDLAYILMKYICAVNEGVIPIDLKIENLDRVSIPAKSVATFDIRHPIHGTTYGV